jgi:endonuclease/exonuclease/phosphatase family metal-dependent hydrolase
MMHASSGEDSWLALVYGPSRENQKAAFLAQLHELRLIRSSPWLFTNDFNMIYRAADKNNARTNRRLVGQFCHSLNDDVLKEVHLNGCLFTQSNERSHPTLERIDRAFISEGWEELFPNNDHSLASICSDHAPLLLCTNSQFWGKKRFHFQAFWLKLIGFLEAVQVA